MNINQINEILKDQNYTVFERVNGELHIKNRSMMNGCLAIISIVAGLVVLFLMKFEPMLFILTLLFWAAPFIYSRWKYPKNTIIDNNKNQLIGIRSFSLSEKFNLNELDTVKVETSTRSSHTSSFEEGNKDYNYYFHITLKEETYKYKLMSLQYRVPCNLEMQKLAEYLSNRIKISSML